MLLFILRRLLAGLLLAFVVVTGMFFFLTLTGTDPARGSLGMYATVAQVEAKRHELGLDRPVFGQYFDWLGNALTGSLGTSSAQNVSVSELILTRLPVTVSLAVGAVLIAALLGMMLGVFAAVRPGRIDRALQIVMVLGFALPNFWVALILAQVFAVQLRWFPATGYAPFLDSPLGWIGSITLPIVALSIGSIAAIAQQIRNSVISVYEQDYIRTLRSRGLPSRNILLTHVLRNASPPALTMLSLQFIAALSGAAIVERVFGLQGIGAVAITASGSGDIQVIMGLLLFTVIVVVAVNFVVDVLYGALNPKVRIA
ncbi:MULTISPECIES: ABC transporter permease [unclassified Arthrobacter]|uniref:ABC transporter permease n=1 Tax=unclassified Arthrobacter TaxID=235627 RepID=UPI001CFFAA3D|nr:MULTISPECIES: ABC transporter permease [unclassified Arthrobacter]MCB5283705.1 Oligopeptide transport system permease protein OppB [Arthrobacter sp. ES1]WGZ80880.1 ABC transporter permease [Arthrobacter sp. EM1]